MSDTTTHEAMAIKAIFDRLASQRIAPAVYGIVGTFELDVENAGRWYLTVGNRSITVSQEADRADCVIGCTAADFIRLVEGKLNLFTAFLQGRVRAAGDVALALRANRLLRLQS